MNKYDLIIAGGGAAGLSLAYHLLHSPLRDRRILIVDRELKNQNDRTWCFWSKRPTYFHQIYFRSWKKVHFESQRFQKTYDLAPYQYHMLRAIDFYRFTRSELEARPNIDFLNAPVHQIWDAPGCALVSAGDKTFQADWCFDSRFGRNDLVPSPAQYHYLKQHFLGWHILTISDVFDPSRPVLFDFRTPQNGLMRFFYILPFSSREALVEYTLFSPEILPTSDYQNGLTDYLSRVLGVRDYEILGVEQGVIPMTDHPFARRAGERILNIGTRGGRVKPSSGYAFLRIQQDSAAIIRSLDKNGHPFGIPCSPARYRLFDSMLLQILYRQGDLAEPVFTELFRNNSIHRVFGFLDETGSLLENIRLMASVPPAPFIRAWMRLKLLRRI